MEAPLILLAIALVLLVIVGPILGIIAFSRVSRLERDRHQQNPQDLTARLYALEQRLARLEKLGAAPPTPVAPSHAEPKPAALPPPLPAAPPPPPTAAPQEPPPSPRLTTPHPPQPPSGFAPPPLHTSLSKDSDSTDLETVIAGRWFNRIAIVALLIGFSFALKFAFDNNWIGPSGRVAIGILLGAAMMPWSSWLLGRGYSYFSEGIVALGEATLFLSVWAGCSYYTLYSRDVGFFGMILITSAMAAVALGRDSQRIAVLCLIGGYLTPILVSTGKDQQVVLFTYLLILGAGMLVMGERKDWYSLAPICFIATEIYYWGWYTEFYHRAASHPLERTVAFATLFFLLFAALPALRAMKEGAMSEIDILVTTVNAFAYVGALYALFWPDDRWPFTLLILALAAGHIAVARVVPDARGKASSLARYLYAGMGLTFATMAIPIRLNGKWITFCFAVEGAVLIWSGFRAASGFLRQFGYLLLAIAAVRVLIFPPPAGAFLFNQRFAAYLIVIACFGVALWSARDKLDDTGEQEKSELGIFSVLINAFALIALSLECWDYFGKTVTGIDVDLARHLSLSVLWTVYATILILVGVQQKSALLRWQALALFGLVVFKVFLFDLASLDRAYRILSFLVLGSVLMIVSFLYTRRAAKGRHP